MHGFCHWYHLHVSNLLCFLNSNGLSSQICPTFLIPENLLLYCTNGQTFHCGVSKNWGRLWPWKHRCRGRRVIRKKNTGLRLEHLEKFIAVRILPFTVSNTNRIGSMGKIIHINHIDVWMHEWINDLGTVKSIHQIINQYTYLCTARGAKHLSEDGAGNSARKPWKIQKDSKPFAQSIMKPVLWWQEWNKHCVQTLHVPSCSKERRVSSYPANFQLPATCHAGGSPEDEPVADQCQDVRRSREVRMVSHNGNFDLSRISFVQSNPRISNLAGLRRRSMPKNCGQALLHEYTEVGCVRTRVLLVQFGSHHTRLQFLRAGRAPTDSDRGIVDIWLAVFWNAGSTMNIDI